MEEKINDLILMAKKEISDIKKEADLLNVKSKYLGKKSEFNALLASLKDMSNEDKKVFGPLLNARKKELEQIFNDKFDSLSCKVDLSFDESLPVNISKGSLHPVTIVTGCNDPLEIFTGKDSSKDKSTLQDKESNLSLNICSNSFFRAFKSGPKTFLSSLLISFKEASKALNSLFLPKYLDLTFSKSASFLISLISFLAIKIKSLIFSSIKNPPSK